MANPNTIQLFDRYTIPRAGVPAKWERSENDGDTWYSAPADTRFAPGTTVAVYGTEAELEHVTVRAGTLEERWLKTSFTPASC